jgi:hypothetical protein
VRPGTVEDELTVGIIIDRVTSAYPADKVGLWLTFAELCSQTEASSGLPFQPERVRDMDAAAQKEAYEAFLKIPKAIKNRWLEALRAADAVVDVVVGPEPLPANADPKA